MIDRTMFENILKTQIFFHHTGAFDWLIDGIALQAASNV